MAKEYIEREAALNASKIVYIEYIEADGEGYEEGNADNIPVVFKKDIEVLPAADVRPVVHARWVRSGDADDGYCSNCKCDMPMCREDWEWKYCETNFCPNCGADMRGGG